MTSIEKLLVQGIRSYDPKESSVIDFYKPLTLIVGINGSGKTTIIECLKYASTGEMPPNCSNGQAFIHDPKIEGEAEVKAQIKLRFKNPNGKPIVAARSLSLIQKANNKQEFRQVDSSLQSFNNEGQKVSKSYRCSDLDKEIPELMGVSKPILKNVIFCHQEDSTWPLSESAKLKVKFDEIFSAVRYTKAIKSIKEKKKELNSNIKESKIKLEVIATNKEHSTRIKKEITHCENQLIHFKESLVKLNQQLNEKKEQFERISGAMKNADSIVAEVQVLEARKNEMERTRNHLLNSLPEVYKESDQELVFMSKSFDEEMGTMQAAQSELQENNQTLLNEKERLIERKNQLAQEMGKLHNTTLHIQKNAQDMDKNLLELTNRYNTIKYQPGVDQATDALNSLFEHYNTISVKLETQKQELKTQTDTLQKELQEKIIERQTLSERSRQYSTQIDANTTKLENLAQEKLKLSSNSLTSQDATSQITTLEQQIQEIELDLSTNQYQSKIDRLIEEKKQISLKMNQLNQDIKLLSNLSTITTKVQLKKKELQTKEKKIQDTLALYQAEILDLLGPGSESDVNTLYSKIDQLKEEYQSEVNETQENLKEITSQYNENENEIKFVQQSKAKQLELMKSHLLKIQQSNIPEFCGSEYNKSMLDEKLGECQTNLSALEKQHAILESENILYQEYIVKANEKKECGLCSRSFKTDTLKGFVSTLCLHVQDIPGKVKDLESKMELEKNLYQQLQELKPISDQYGQCKEKEIPILDQRLKELQLVSEDLEPTKTSLEQQLSELTPKLNLANMLLVNIKPILQWRIEANSTKQEIDLDEKEMKLDQATDELMKQGVSIKDKMSMLDSEKVSYDHVQQEIDGNENKLKNQNNLLLRKKQSIINLKEQQSAQQNSIEILSRISKSETELTELNQNLLTQIKELKITIKQLIESIDKKEKEYNDSKNQYETKINSMSKEKNVFGNKLTVLKNMSKQQQELIEQSKRFNVASDGGAEIEITQEMERLTQTIQEVDMDCKKGQEAIDVLKSSLLTRETTKRTIQDNLQIRQMKLNIDTLVSQIQKKRQSIEGLLTAEDASAFRTLNQDISLLKSKIDQSTGSIDAIEQQKRTNLTEIQKPIYKDVEIAYRDMISSIEATEVVNKDLDKYAKALDKALMKYHTLKMDEINKSIRELWQSTYRGNDIDTIEIRSEETDSAKKTVNYRVVMVKGDVELDMRGRCSAGQKVLACLVIRLALAENFCSNCGILALDEPTSHLDRANIESFALALLNIIEARKTQRGFQLIIITHDEEFVQYLSRGNFTDFYWRVSKDANQHSVVEKKEISKM